VGEINNNIDIKLIIYMCCILPGMPVNSGRASLIVDSGTPKDMAACEAARAFDWL
jgi:hypothetical protein